MTDECICFVCGLDVTEANVGAINGDIFVCRSCYVAGVEKAKLAVRRCLNMCPTGIFLTDCSKPR